MISGLIHLSPNKKRLSQQKNGHAQKCQNHHHLLKPFLKSHQKEYRRILSKSLLSGLWLTWPANM